jgi:hypothetical protein
MGGWMVKRLNYFDGQFLRAKDFSDEQTYHIGMRQKHNSLLHSWGIADGLFPSADKGAIQVKVSVGFAIDSLGREIELDSEAASDDLTPLAGKSTFLTIRWNEVDADPTTEAGGAGVTRKELKPVIEFADQPQYGQQLVLGKITVDAQGHFQSVDTSSAIRTMAGAKGGDLSAVSLRLTGLNIDPSVQPRLSVSTAQQVDLQGSLQINGNLGVTGTVGIGTASPAQKLDVVGGIGFSGNNLNARDKKLYAPADGDLEWMTNNGAGAHGFAISNQGAKAVYLNTSGSSYLNGGNVGIGTTTPQAPLDVGGATTNNPQAILARGADNNFQLYAANGSGNNAGNVQATFGLRYAGQGDVATLSFVRGAGAKDATIAFNTQAAERMRIDAAGNVGIGLTAPTLKLDVADRIRLREGPSGTAGLWLYQNAPKEDRAFIGMSDDGHVGFWGNKGVGWGMTMDVANGNVQFAGRATDKKIRVVAQNTNLISTNGTTWQNMPDLSLTINAAITAPFQIVAIINGVQGTDGNNIGAYFRLNVDNQQRDMTREEFNHNGWELRGVTLSCLITLNPGQHSIQVQWMTTGQKVTCCWYGDTRQLQVIEL